MTDKLISTIITLIAYFFGYWMGCHIIESRNESARIWSAAITHSVDRVCERFAVIEIDEGEE